MSIHNITVNTHKYVLFLYNRNIKYFLYKLKIYSMINIYYGVTFNSVPKIYRSLNYKGAYIDLQITNDIFNLLK